MVASNQTNQAPILVPAPPTVEPILDEPVQGVSPLMLITF